MHPTSLFDVPEVMLARIVSPVRQSWPATTVLPRVHATVVLDTAGQRSRMPVAPGSIGVPYTVDLDGV